MRHLSAFPLLVALIALAPAAPCQTGSPSSAATAKSRASARIMQLRCRGGPGFDFKVISNPSKHNAAYVTMSLHYRHVGPAREGADPFAALAPGTCSWNDPKAVEPGEVTFDLVADAQASQVRRGIPVDRSVNAAYSFEDTATVPRFMTDPGHYYSFYVWESGDNFSQSHGAYQIGRPAEGSIIAAAAGTTPAKAKPSIEKARSTTAPRLKFVESNTSLDFFNLRFTARSGAAPVVSYSTTPPIRDPLAGQHRLGAQAELHLRAPIPMEIRESSGVPSTYIASTRQAPERGKTYYFLITVPAGEGLDEEQYSGRIIAVSETIRIVFTQAVVLNAKYDNIRLWLSANDMTLDTTRVSSSKGTYPLHSAITISNPKAGVTISVQGECSRGFNAIKYDNSASAYFSIPKSSERYIRIPFRMKSPEDSSIKWIPRDTTLQGNFDLPVKHDPGGLVFEISGYMEVTRK